MGYSVRITKKGLAWHRSGHPWIYKDDVEKADEKLSGAVVAVSEPSGKFLGKAFYSRNSKIALRLITREDVETDKAFWAERIKDALSRREKAVTNTNAYRIAHAEADYLPSLVIDAYGGHLVIQTLCAGMDAIKEMIVEILVELIKPKSVAARNDAAARKLEGLPEEKRVLYGSPPEKVEVYEKGIKYLVDILNGQKTGAYLDQRENRIASEIYAKGKALDCFSYEGLFSLHIAASAEEVTAVESSEAALKNLEENAKLNAITNLKPEKGNVFDVLKSYLRQSRQFDLIVLDPPAFAKSKGDLNDAVRGYIDINFRAMKLVSPGGHLISCSCSYNLPEGGFLEIIREALKESKRQARLIEKRIQPPDHPILLNFPESNYLKCLILELL